MNKFRDLYCRTSNYHSYNWHLGQSSGFSFHEIRFRVIGTVSVISLQLQSILNLILMNCTGRVPPFKTKQLHYQDQFITHFKKEDERKAPFGLRFLQKNFSEEKNNALFSHRGNGPHNTAILLAILVFLL